MNIYKKSIVAAVIIIIVLIEVLVAGSKNFVYASTLNYSMTTNNNIVMLDVPFTSQAPYGNWADLRQEDGCEEATAVMAMSWVNNKLLTRSRALSEILAISNFEQLKYKNYHDTSARDTVDRIFKGYYGYKKVTVKYDINSTDIKYELKKGNLVIVPVNGQKIHNPYFKQPGPEHHKLVIKGFDYNTKEYITNDPGTRRGNGFRYKESVLVNAISAYPTGNHISVKYSRKAMIIVSK